MKAAIGFVTFAAGLVLNTFAADNASEVNVQSTSDVMVAVVDTTRVAGGNGTTVHEAFAESLGATLSKQAGGQVNVKITEVDAFRLAFDLKSGMYDAIFIVGNNLPPAIKKGDFEILRAVSEAGTPGRVFHLVVPAADPTLKKMISSSFPVALSAPKFQEAMARSVAIKINADALKKAAGQSIVDTTATR